MWEAILFFAEGLTAAELGAYSPGFIPAPGSISYEGEVLEIHTERSQKAIFRYLPLQKLDKQSFKF